MKSLFRIAIAVSLICTAVPPVIAAKKIKITGTLHEPVTMTVGNGARTEIITSLPFVFEVEKSDLPMNLTFESPHYLYYEIQVPKKPFDDTGHVYLMKIDETAMAMRMNSPADSDSKIGRPEKSMAQLSRDLKAEMTSPLNIYYVDENGAFMTLTSPVKLDQKSGNKLADILKSKSGMRYEARNYGAVIPRQNQGFYIKASSIGALACITLTPFENDDDCRFLKIKTGKAVKFDSKIDMTHEEVAPGIYHLSVPQLAAGDYAIVQHYNGEVVSVTEFTIDPSLKPRTDNLSKNTILAALDPNAAEKAEPEKPMLARNNAQKGAGEGISNIKTKESQPSSDIDINIPSGGLVAENTFALVIANEDYTRVAPVPYAKNDGRIFKKYLHQTFGLDDKSVIYLENATYNDLKFAINRISEIAKAFSGDASIIVYYSGHGIPNEATGEGFLLPVDGYGTDTSTALSISELYKTISDLPIKKATMFMDACFSGAKRDGGMLVAARGVAIKAKASAPKGKIVVLSAATEDQTAYPYEEKQHGLMTYFLLKKIQSTQGKVNIGELFNYVETNVKRNSIIENGKLQTPVSAVSPVLANSWKELTIW